MLALKLPMAPRLPTLASACALASFLRLAAGCGGDAHYMGGPPNSGSEVSSGAASGSAANSISANNRRFISISLPIDDPINDHIRVIRNELD